MLSRPHTNPPEPHNTRGGVSNEILVIGCGALDPLPCRHTFRHIRREEFDVYGYTTDHPDKIILDE